MLKEMQHVKIIFIIFTFISPISKYIYRFLLRNKPNTTDK